MRQLARSSGLNLAGSIVAATLNLLLPVLITRNLTKDDAGIFFQATALFTVLVSVGTLGADTGVLRALPRAIALRRSKDIGALLRIALSLPVGISVVLAVVLAVMAGPLGDLATGGDKGAALFTRSVLVLSPVLPLAVAYAIGLSTSRALGSVVPLVVVEKLGRGSLQVAAIALALAVGGSVLLAVLAWTLPYVAALLVIGFWIVRSAAREKRKIEGRLSAPAKAPSVGLAGEFWRFSGPRAASRVFAVALQRFDILIVGALRGPAEAAVYAAATRFPILGLMFVQAIQQVMAPRISEFLARDNHDRALSMYRTTTTWLTLVSWPIYLLSVSYPGVLLDVFGGGYDRAARVVVILCLTMLVATACGPVDSVLLMGGRSVLSLGNTAVALTATVTIDLLLIPDHGITGAAIGWAVGILLNNLLPLVQVHQVLHMHPFGSATLAAVALCVATYGLIPALLRIVLGANLTSLFLAGLLATLVFLAAGTALRRTLALDALVGAMRRQRPHPPVVSTDRP